MFQVLNSKDGFTLYGPCGEPGKSVIIPDGLHEIMTHIAKKVMKERPINMVQFIAEDLESELQARKKVDDITQFVDVSVIGTATKFLTYLEHGYDRGLAMKAATKIQAAFRGYKVRAALQDINALMDRFNTKPTGMEEEARSTKDFSSNLNGYEDEMQKEDLQGLRVLKTEIDEHQVPINIMKEPAYNQDELSIYDAPPFDTDMPKKDSKMSALSEYVPLGRTSSIRVMPTISETTDMYVSGIEIVDKNQLQVPDDNKSSDNNKDQEQDDQEEDVLSTGFETRSGDADVQSLTEDRIRGSDSPGLQVKSSSNNKIPASTVDTQHLTGDEVKSSTELKKEYSKENKAQDSNENKAKLSAEDKVPLESIGDEVQSSTELKKEYSTENKARVSNENKAKPSAEDKVPLESIGDEVQSSTEPKKEYSTENKARDSNENKAKLSAEDKVPLESIGDELQSSTELKKEYSTENKAPDSNENKAKLSAENKVPLESIGDDSECEDVEEEDDV